MRRTWILLTLCWFALGMSGIHADPLSDNAQRARAHFEAGRALYSLGNYESALAEFTAGYDLAPRPGFLVNIGHCQRRLQHLQQARDAYREFLRVAAQDAPESPQVRTALAEVDAQIAALPPANTPVAPQPSLTPPAAAPPPVVVANPAPRPRSAWRRYFWLLPVSAVVVAGGALGLYFGLRSRSNAVGCSDAELGCLRPAMP
jgi:tetratricopeptide (TPR) repeat protein